MTVNIIYEHIWECLYYHFVITTLRAQNSFPAFTIGELYGTMKKEVKVTESAIHVHMSSVARKHIFGVSDQVPNKPACTTTKYSQWLEIFETLD